MKSLFFYSSIFFLILQSCSEQTSSERKFTINFDQSEIGKLTDRETKNIWPGASLVCGKKDFIFYKFGITPHPFSISEEDGNNFLATLIPKNSFGSITGAQWKFPLATSDEYYLSYNLKFDKNFDFVKGGKLPGLAGGTANSGGNIPDGYDGWSARMMFWEEGKISFYLYFPTQTSQFGERFYLQKANGDTIKAKPGEWHQIAQHIIMNTPGEKDGIVQGWFDGEEVFYTDTILFRMDEQLKIDQIFFSVFLGGDDLSWASKKDEYIYFDDFNVSTQMPD